MYQKIMVPVDLAHKDALDKPLTVAADLASHYNAQLFYVSVTASAPGPVARTPDEYQQKLDAFAQEHGKAHDQTIETRLYVTHDPAVDLEDTLVKAIQETGSDLVVMGTHAPSWMDALVPSHSSKVAKHTKASVFLVRS